MGYILMMDRFSTLLCNDQAILKKFRETRKNRIRFDFNEMTTKEKNTAVISISKEDTVAIHLITEQFLSNISRVIMIISS